MHRSPDGLRVLRAHTGLQAVGTRSARGVIKRYGPAFVSMGDGDTVMTNKERLEEINVLISEVFKAMRVFGVADVRLNVLKDLLEIREMLIDN